MGGAPASRASRATTAARSPPRSRRRRPTDSDRYRGRRRWRRPTSSPPSSRRPRPGRRAPDRAGSPRSDGDSGPVGQPAGRAIVALEVADDPSAAVEVDQHGQLVRWRRTGRPIEADRNVARRTGNVQLPDLSDIGPGPLGRHRDDEVAGILDREVRELGHPELLQEVEHFLGLRMDGHAARSVAVRHRRTDVDRPVRVRRPSASEPDDVGRDGVLRQQEAGLDLLVGALELAVLVLDDDGVVVAGPVERGRCTDPSAPRRGPAGAGPASPSRRTAHRGRTARRGRSPCPWRGRGRCVGRTPDHPLVVDHLPDEV